MARRVVTLLENVSGSVAAATTSACLRATHVPSSLATAHLARNASEVDRWSSQPWPLPISTGSPMSGPASPLARRDWARDLVSSSAQNPVLLRLRHISPSREPSWSTTATRRLSTLDQVVSHNVGPCRRWHSAMVKR